MSGKIIGVSNKEKTLWVTLRYYDGIVEDLHNLILECMDDNEEYPGIGLNFYNEEEDGNFLLPYEKMKGRTHDFYQFEEESIIIIFQESNARVILLKNSSKYEELKDELIDIFGFAEYKGTD